LLTYRYTHTACPAPGWLPKSAGSSPEVTGQTAWGIAAILNYLKESLKQQSVEGEYAYILWTAETADNVYDVGTARS
jgi:hypothetical protein